jgi:hypothetical protein
MSTSDEKRDKISQLKENLKETVQKAKQQAKRFGLGVALGAATILPSFAQQNAPTQTKKTNNIEQTQKQPSHTVRSELGTVTYTLNNGNISMTSSLAVDTRYLMPGLYDYPDGHMRIGPLTSYIENNLRTWADLELREVVQNEIIYQDLQQRKKHGEKLAEGYDNWMSVHDKRLKNWGIKRTVNDKNVVTLLQTAPQNSAYKTRGISFKIDSDYFPAQNTKKSTNPSKYTIQDAIGELSYTTANGRLEIENTTHTYTGLSGWNRLIPDKHLNQQTGKIKWGPVTASNKDQAIQEMTEQVLEMMDMARIYSDIKSREANGEKPDKVKQDYCQTTEKQLKDDWNIEIQYKDSTTSLKNLKTQYVFQVPANNQKQQQAQNNIARIAQTRGGGR